eukprot:Platyproteum_vivax@DN5594_c1_g1_i1.p1
MNLLKGKRCVITGASGGVGEAIAITFAKQAAELVLVGRNQEKLNAVAEKCKSIGAPNVETATADFSKAEAVDILAKNLLQKPVHVLVNNAGCLYKPDTCLTLDPNQADEVLQVNLHTPIRMTRHLAPAMVERKSGTIINIGSIGGLDAFPSSAAYSASKWGLRGFHMSCYEEMRRSNVKVLLINPAFIRTNMVKGAKGANPARMIDPTDVAEVALLPFATGSSCCPVEVTLRLTLDAYQFD